jgi:hypothetical protein
MGKEYSNQELSIIVDSLKKDVKNLQIAIESIPEQPQSSILHRIIKWFGNSHPRDNEQLSTMLSSINDLSLRMEDICKDKSKYIEKSIEQDESITKLIKKSIEQDESITKLTKKSIEQDESITKLDQYFRKDQIDDMVTHSSIAGKQHIPSSRLMEKLESFPKAKFLNLAKLIADKKGNSSKEEIHRICSQLCKIILVDGMKKEHCIDALQSEVKQGLSQIGVKISGNEEYLVSYLEGAIQLLKEIKDSAMQGELYWIDSDSTDENKFEDEKHQPVNGCKRGGKVQFTVYPGYFTENKDGRKYHLLATVWTDLEGQES